MELYLRGFTGNFIIIILIILDTILSFYTFFSYSKTQKEKDCMVKYPNLKSLQLLLKNSYFFSTKCSKKNNFISYCFTVNKLMAYNSYPSRF